ncbi:MAG: hypothetical protein ACE5R6_11325 [Candidatus Heimdallarchaeota archaeon]
MTTYGILPFFTTLISGAFTISVFLQYRRRKKTHQLVWAIALAIFCVTAFFEAYSEIFDWNSPVYKAYYVLAAVQVLILGSGTVYLLHDKKVIGNAYVPPLFLSYGLVVGLIMSYKVATTSVYVEKFVKGIIVAGTAMPDSARSFSPLLTIPGSIALIGGALYSWIKIRRRFNLYIALGALIVAMSGGIARMGITDAIYLGEMIGVTLMYFGFLESDRILKRREKKKAERNVVVTIET